MPAPLDQSPASAPARGALILLIAAVVGGVVMVTSMLKKQAESGESYPVYSSLRADPLGTRVLHDALDRLPGVSSERNFLRMRRLVGRPGKTYVFTGIEGSTFNSANRGDLDELPRLAVEGSRLVIALEPTSGDTRIMRNIGRAIDELDEEDRETEKKGGEKDDKAAKQVKKVEKEQVKEPVKEKPKADSPAMKGYLDRLSLGGNLKLRVDMPENGIMDAEGVVLKASPDRALSTVSLPPWHSLNSLDDDPSQDWPNLLSQSEKRLAEKLEKSLNERDAKAGKPAKEPKPTPPKSKPTPNEKSPWITLATAANKPVIMERKLGTGSVVVCTDRYFLSNEALWKHQYPALLAWLIGGADTVVFEETHLGSSIGDGEGIMTLARQYRMQGLFVGGLLLFGLFIWRSTTSLVPHDSSADLGYWRQDAVAGQSAASGLEGMIRRGIPLDRMLRRCLTAWRTTAVASGGVPKERQEQAEAALAEAKSFKTFPAAYQRIRDLLYPPRKS